MTRSMAPARAIWRLFGAAVAVLAASLAASGGGMVEPVMEPSVVVSASEPVTKEPAYTGKYGTGSGAGVAASVAGTMEHEAPDSPNTAGQASAAQGPARRVLCLTLSRDQRGGAGPFALCAP